MDVSKRFEIQNPHSVKQRKKERKKANCFFLYREKTTNRHEALSNLVYLKNTKLKLNEHQTAIKRDEKFVRTSSSISEVKERKKKRKKEDLFIGRISF